VRTRPAPSAWRSTPALGHGSRIPHASVGSTLIAQGGVVLACGGFEADPALADAYLPVGPVLAGRAPGEHRRRTADGAAGRGGALAMYGCFGWFAFRCAEYSSPFAHRLFGASHLFTDADGRRFADETGYEVHDRLRALLSYLPRNPNRPHLPAGRCSTRRRGRLAR